MCDYKILHYSEHGYAVKCLKCDCLKVGFSSNAITFTNEQFYDFKEIIDRSYNRHKRAICRDQKQFEINTAAQSVKLVYSVNELERLAALLGEAELTLEIEKLLAE